MKRSRPYSYAAGGMVGPEGQPVGLQPQGAPPAPAAPQMDAGDLNAQVNQFIQQHPEEVQRIHEAIQMELQSGELTEEQLHQMVQLATVAAQNPEMYPQIRQYALQQGMATEQDLPEQMDQGMIFSLLIAGQALQGPQTPEGHVPSMAAGGSVPGAKTKQKGVVIEAHEGEYVVPKNVVMMKGKEFFDKLIEKYNNV